MQPDFIIDKHPVHCSIASFHYAQLRGHGVCDVSQLPKSTLQLCKYHYEKATQILESLKEVRDLLVVQLERISLHEFLADGMCAKEAILKLTNTAYFQLICSFHPRCTEGQANASCFRHLLPVPAHFRARHR